MNNNSNKLERSPLDYIHFAIIFFGLWMLVAGALTQSIPAAGIGAIMLMMGAGYFLLTASPDE